MLKEKCVFLVPVVMLGVSVYAADSAIPAKSDDAKQASPDFTVRIVNAGRQEVLASSDEKIHKANRAFLAGQYDTARDIYRDIASVLERYPGEAFVKRREFCTRRIEECYSKKAEEAMVKADDSVSVGDFEEAIRLCKEAVVFCPGRKDELEKKIAFYEKRHQAAITREKRNINVLKNGYSENNYKIDLLIEQGRALVKREEYIKAKRCFEEVLLIDPFNDTAMQNMLAVNTLIQQAAKLRSNATQRRATAMDKWSGAVPIAKDTENDTAANNIETAVVKNSNQNTIVDILKSIKPRDTNFNDMGFEEVVDFVNRSIKGKSDANVNVIFKSNPDQSKEVRIENIRKPNANLYEWLEDLQNVHKMLTFRVDKKALYIAAAGVPLEKNEVRVFEVSLPSQISSDTALEEYVVSHGVQFDKNLNQEIKRHRIDGYVIARHTPDNLDKIKQALDDLSSDEPDMVQLMFKFLEVRQDDLDELAFSWQYARTGNNVAFTSGNSLLRHYSRGDGEDTPRYSGTAMNESVDDANIYFTWTDQKNQLDFQLYALDWADNKSILYAPRVTTISGKMAHVKISTQRHFTDEWEYIDEEQAGNLRFEGAFMPDLSLSREIGLQPFNVTPQISGQTVSMSLNLAIKQYVGSTEYIIVDGDDPEKITKPIFNDRKISTTVTVKDCSTVFVGGVITDATSKIHDKIPILGDIPLIGRFFQSRYTKSEKVNLMVFVSCRIIKPDGSLRYPSNAIQSGLPTFSNNM